MSQIWRPRSVRFQRKNDHSPPGMMRRTYGALFSMCDALTTYRVSVGSWPLSVLKMPSKIGTRNMSMPMRTSVAKMSTIVG